MTTPNIPTLIRTELLLAASGSVFAESLWPTAEGYKPEDSLAVCFRVQSAPLLDETLNIYDTVVEIRVYGPSELEIQTEVMSLRDQLEGSSRRIRHATILSGPTTQQDLRTEWLYTRINYRLHVVGG